VEFPEFGDKGFRSKVDLRFGDMVYIENAIDLTSQFVGIDTKVEMGGNEIRGKKLGPGVLEGAHIEITVFGGGLSNELVSGVFGSEVLLREAADSLTEEFARLEVVCGSYEVEIAKADAFSKLRVGFCGNQIENGRKTLRERLEYIVSGRFINDEGRSEYYGLGLIAAAEDPAFALLYLRRGTSEGDLLNLFFLEALEALTSKSILNCLDILVHLEHGGKPYLGEHEYKRGPFKLECGLFSHVWGDLRACWLKQYYTKSNAESNNGLADLMRAIAIIDGERIRILDGSSFSGKYRCLFSVAGSPIGVGIDPGLKMVGTEIRHPQVGGDGVDEGLAANLIPIVGARGAVLLAPVEKEVDDSRDGLRGDLPLSRLGHQVVIAFEGKLTVGAEIVLLAVKLHVPRGAVLAEPRFGESRHEKTLQLGKPWEHPGELKGSPPKRAAWQCDRPGKTLTRSVPLYHDLS
jgi:hypothetical protein